MFREKFDAKIQYANDLHDFILKSGLLFITF